MAEKSENKKSFNIKHVDVEEQGIKSGDKLIVIYDR